MRIRKFLITLILIVCGMLFFVACKSNRVVQEIALNDYSAETPLEIKVGKFSYSEYSLTVTYDNGESEIVPLTEEMISETDKLKFYQEGKSEITITYEDVSVSVAIQVQRNVFEDNVQLNDVNVTYTGEPYVIEVEGDIPGGTKILYPQGNTFTNAGAYDMTAVLQCDGYVSKQLFAHVVIEKATYDVSDAQLYDTTFVYDKNSHSVAVKGKAVESEDGEILHEPANIPKGVSVSYTITKVKDGYGTDIAINKQQVVEGNKATDAGTYKVCGKFKGDSGNYHAIPDTVAYVTIERAVYDMSKIALDDVTAVYSGEAHSLSISETSEIPFDVEIAYEIKKVKDGAGQAVADVYKSGNTATDAGEYWVRVSFTITGKSADNYIASPAEIVAYLTIERAKYDETMQNVYLDSQWYQMNDSHTYEIYLEGELPDGVSPQFTVTNSKGEALEGEMELVTSDETDGQTSKSAYKYVFTTDAEGDYTCIVTFTHNDKNYEDITLELEAWIFITDVE